MTMASGLFENAPVTSSSILSMALLALLGCMTAFAISKLFYHPLTKYPGPKLAALTRYWQAFVKLVRGRSFVLELAALHKQHGPIIRVGPNELHFADPQAYLDIYRSSNRWDKEEALYHSFGEDRSSFGFLDYKSAKTRKDVLNRAFSIKAVADSEDLVQDKVDQLCATFGSYSKEGRLIDASRAFRCFTIDVITHLCFGIPIDAIAAPDFRAPIIVAMDESMKIFPAFRYFSLVRHMIMDCPPKLSRIISPLTAGLVDLQEILRSKIDNLATGPEALEKMPHNKTIFHVLMSPEAHNNGTVPSTGSLYEESQALMFGGGDTAGNALMVTIFHLLKNPATMQQLKRELQSAWPKLDGAAPRYNDLEALPYLDAVLREGLRMSNGVVSGLLRVIPEQGAVVVGEHIPGGTVVSCASPFVHTNSRLFPEPAAFKPERWLDNVPLHTWLVAFSRGPRSCLGVNLAWLELRLMLAHTVRRFDLALDPSSPAALTYKDAFLPHWTSKPVMLKATPVAA